MKRWMYMSATTSLLTIATVETLFQAASGSESVDLDDAGCVLIRGAAYVLISAATSIFFYGNRKWMDNFIEYRNLTECRAFVLGDSKGARQRATQTKGDSDA